MCSMITCVSRSCIRESSRRTIDVEAATLGKIFFGVGVEGGQLFWTTADGKDAFHALHVTSAVPSADGKYVIMIDPAKSDPGVSVTIRFIDHP